MELVSLFWIHRVIYLTDLSAGFITTNIPKLKKNVEKKEYIIVEKLDGVGPVDNRPSTKNLHHLVQKKSK